MLEECGRGGQRSGDGRRAQLGVGGGTPTPRKLSEPSATIITDIMVSA